MPFKTISLGILLSLLSACGGGGGPSDPTPVVTPSTPAPAPIVLSATGLTGQMLADNRMQVVFSGTNAATAFCARSDSVTPAASDGCFTDQTTQTVPTSGSATLGTAVRAWTRTGTGAGATVAFHQQLAGPGKTCSTAAYAASTVAVSVLTPAPDPATLPTVCMITDKGEMVILLEAAAAPRTVTNFLRYVHEGFYNNTCFHRIFSSVVQGGTYNSATCLQPLQEKRTYNPIDIEPFATTRLSNAAGTIAMARTSDLNSATAGFFFNVLANPGYDAAPYAAFGRVVYGVARLTELVNVPLVGTQPVNPPAVQWAYQIK